MKPVLAVALSLLLTACAVGPRAPDVTRPGISDWRPPEVPQQWALEGRAAIRTGSDSGTVSVSWRHTARERYRIDLRAPFGAGVVRIEGGPQQVTLRTGDGEVYRAASARHLLQTQTGYDLPVQLLAWWVRGVPAPEWQSRVWPGTAGHPKRIEQAGWRVEYLDFTVVDGYTLPRRLTLSREDIEVRLAVRQWRLDDG